MFNITKFLDDYNIESFTEGKNTSKGWISVQCPMCQDSGNHGAFSLNGWVNYHCWKCGKHPIKSVLAKLTNENPNAIIAKYSTQHVIKSKLQHNKHKYNNKNTTIKVPGEKLQRRHRHYLRKRDFYPPELVEKYDLKGTGIMGSYPHRIIAPIYYNGKIVSYQGRDITGQSSLRYKACKIKDEIIHHKHILYNLDNCNQDWVVVCEGITDVWRLGDNSCCTFGIKYKKEQVALLKKRFKKVYIFFDSEEQAQEQAEKLGNELSNLGIDSNIISFEGDGKFDAGSMKQEEADNLMDELRKENE